MNSLSTQSDALERVLIVDDEKDACLLLSRLLTPLGYDITYRHRLDQVGDVMNNWKPDIILLDINLEDGNGLDYMKANELYKHAKVVMMSAQRNYSNQAMASGAKGFLEKPFSKQRLVTLLKN